MSKSTARPKLVTEFPVTVYQCGARAGETVRLRRELVIRDHRKKPTGEVHPVGEVWKVVRGSAEIPPVLWLRQPDGAPHVWSDDVAFWDWFERVAEPAA